MKQPFYDDVLSKKYIPSSKKAKFGAHAVFEKNGGSLCLFVCLFDWALDSEIQLWVGPCCGVQPLAQGVGVFVTPLLPHLRREAGEPVRQSQERGYWEGSYGQFNPNTT